MTDDTDKNLKRLFNSRPDQLSGGGRAWLTISILLSICVLLLFTNAGYSGNKLFDPFGTSVHERQSQGVYHK